MGDMAEDFREWREHKKQQRQKAEDYFKDNLLPKIKAVGQTHWHESGKYILDHPKFGKVDIWPKAGKYLVRKENKWYYSIKELIRNQV